MKKVSVTTKTHRRQQEGFALILALLALMLLTSLGLSLSTTTSTELQIATNHRWSEQARYNAEAGIEFGKQFLTTINNWESILPPARVAGQGWPANQPVGAPRADALFNRADPWGNPSRNYDNWTCDSRGFGRGYGVVLDDGTGVPQQYVTQVGGLNLNGAFTLWIRRPVKWQDDGANATTLVDYVPTPAPVPGNGVLVLVSEGVAPFTGGVATAGSANRASFILEVLLAQGASNTVINAGGTLSCNARQGQAGGNAQGTNAQGCSLLNGSSITTALQGAINLGTGNLR
jgi:Tfp pilus assembly protein PilX